MRLNPFKKQQCWIPNQVWDDIVRVWDDSERVGYDIL